MHIYLHRCFLAGMLTLACSSLASLKAFAVPPISPGDIVFTDSFGDWYKYNPNTDQATDLSWTDAPFGTADIAFDNDGSILLSSVMERGYQRLNPITGVVSSISIPVGIDPESFVIEDNGDLLSMNETGVFRYTPNTMQTLFSRSPYTLSNGDITRLFDDRVFAAAGSAVFEVSSGVPDLMPLTLTSAGGDHLSLGSIRHVDSQSNGDLIVYDRGQGFLFRVNPETGFVSRFAENFDFTGFADDLTVDSSDNVLVTTPTGLFRVDPTGQMVSEIAEEVFGGREFVLVVPDDWSFTNVPEPSSVTLLSVFASIAVLGSRQSH